DSLTRTTRGSARAGSKIILATYRAHPYPAPSNRPARGADSGDAPRFGPTPSRRKRSAGFPRLQSQRGLSPITESQLLESVRAFGTPRGTRALQSLQCGPATSELTSARPAANASVLPER